MRISAPQLSRRDHSGAVTEFSEPTLSLAASDSRVVCGGIKCFR